MQQNKTTMYKMMAVFASTYIALSMSFVVIMPYLQYLELTKSQQGWFMAGGSLVSILGQMTVGFLCDRFRTLRKTNYAITFALGLVCWTFYSLNKSLLLLVLVVGSLIQALFTITNGVLDSWALEVNDYCKDNYGAIRAFGAIGWIIGGPIVHWVQKNYGFSYLGLAYLAFIVLAWIIAYLTPDAEKLQTENSTEKLQLRDIRMLLTNSRYVILILTFFAIFFIFRSDGSLTIWKIGELAANQDDYSKWVSYRSSFQALFELPSFFLGAYLMKRFGNIKLLIIAICACMLRGVINILATEPLHILLASSLQLLTFPLINMTSKALVHLEIPDNMKSSGQQFALSVYSSGAALLSPIVIGYLSEKLGINVSLTIVVALAVIPLALCFVYQKMRAGYDSQFSKINTD